MYNYGCVNFLLNIENQKILFELKKIFYPHIWEKKDTQKEDFKFTVSTNEEEYLMYKNKLKLIEGTQLFVTKCSKKIGEIILERKKYDSFNIFEYIGKKILIVEKENNYILYYLEKSFDINKIHKGIFVILEHIIQKYMNLKGGVLLHASAVSNETGKITLFIGEKRSGKTTMFIDSCYKNEVIPIAVDKVYIYLNDLNELEVKGFPSRLRILSGTLSKYEKFRKFIPDKYRNVSKDILWMGSSDGKVTIELTEFENIINRKFQSTGILEKIIFPKINKNEEFSIKNIDDHKKIFSKLDKCIYTPVNIEEDWWSNIGKNNEKNIIESKNQIIKKMVDEFKFMEIVAGEKINSIPLN